MFTINKSFANAFVHVDVYDAIHVLEYGFCFEVNKQRLSHDEIFCYSRLCLVSLRIFHPMLWSMIGTEKILPCFSSNKQLIYNKRLQKSSTWHSVLFALLYTLKDRV